MKTLTTPVLTTDNEGDQPPLSNHSPTSSNHSDDDSSDKPIEDALSDLHNLLYLHGPNIPEGAIEGDPGPVGGMAPDELVEDHIEEGVPQDVNPEDTHSNIIISAY